MLDVGINHIDLGNRNDFSGVNYRNYNQLAHTESPLFHLLSSYWFCKTQIILPLCEVFINSFSCSWIFVALFCVPQVLSLIPPTSIYQNLYANHNALNPAVQEGLHAQEGLAIRTGRQEHTGTSAPMEVCCAEKHSHPSLSVPWSWDLLELPHVPQQATDRWRQDLGPAPTAEHTTETQCLFPQQKNKTTKTNKKIKVVLVLYSWVIYYQTNGIC